VLQQDTTRRRHASDPVYSRRRRRPRGAPALETWLMDWTLRRWPAAAGHAVQAQVLTMISYAVAALRLLGQESRAAEGLTGLSGARAGRRCVAHDPSCRSTLPQTTIEQTCVSCRVKTRFRFVAVCP
jgi:hypothetical protein